MNIWLQLSTCELHLKIGRMNKWMSEWINEWVDELINEWMNECFGWMLSGDFMETSIVTIKKAGGIFSDHDDYN